MNVYEVSSVWTATPIRLPRKPLLKVETKKGRRAAHGRLDEERPEEARKKRRSARERRAGDSIAGGAITSFYPSTNMIGTFSRSVNPLPGLKIY